MPSSYVLEKRYEAFVRQQIDLGRYQTASEVICDGLRLIEEQAALEQAKLRPPFGVFLLIQRLELVGHLLAH